ncbi:MAG: 50S ribosome-binding GTPase, partial [Actinobacteria bacterium]|nr:50S ribosome-binding GTPase [Actinomycetota bacterium]
MTEGQDVAARPASERGNGRDALGSGRLLADSDFGHAIDANPGMEHEAVPGSASAEPSPTYSYAPVPEQEFSSPGPHDEAEAPIARVDARRLESALLKLRHPIVTVPLLLEAPRVAEARAERVKLLSQIDDYLLPRLRQSGAPILVALVGSTGAGKSTLMNTIVGKEVSATGVLRPTTNSPVLASHPDDMRWFAENVFLPTMPRVRQQGLAMPGRDGLLVLAATEGMPRGVAILDTPDIDSVVEAHHDFAHQFLDASDLWLFVTTARRYADAAVWKTLKDARDRGAALAVALSRVPDESAAELQTHFDAMLDANGLGDVARFLVPETVVKDAMLPTEVVEPVKAWLTDTARQEDRRMAVLTQTMSGVLDTFRSRVPGLADLVNEQLTVRRELQMAVEDAFTAGLEQVVEATRSGSLLQGEVLARWQDFAGAGDLLRGMQVRRNRDNRAKKVNEPAASMTVPSRASALREAVQVGLESLVIAAAAKAAEDVVASWQRQQAGASLLRDLDAAARRVAAGEDFVATALADLGITDAAGPPADRRDSAALATPTGGLAAAAAAEISGWQEHVRELVQTDNVTKRSVARVVSFDADSLALVLTIGLLAPKAKDEDATEDASAAPQQLLASLFGAGLLRSMGTRVRRDLRQRVKGLFLAEARRYFDVIDSAGVPDEGAGTALL